VDLGDNEVYLGFRDLMEVRVANAFIERGLTDGTLLRGELGFEGLIMTDDLDMGAILNEYGFKETICRAIGAGNDLAMICHRVPAIAEAFGYIEELPADQLERALTNIASCKANLAAPEEFSESAFASLNDEIWDLRVAVLGEERARELSVEDGKRSPVESY
jgi:beta-N-acetylhexosaminidase